MALPIETILDERHRIAQDAFRNRDAAAYEALFSPRLAYTQANGETIGRDTLMRDVREQFARLKHMTSEFAREALAMGDSGRDDEVTETLTQTATTGTSAFGFIHRRWHILRRGHYIWAREDGDWRLIRVQVLSETVRGSWRYGF